MLLVDLRAYQPPPSDSVVAVVSLRHGQAQATEVGRFSPYPATAFEAPTAAAAQRYQFDVTDVVPAGGGENWTVNIRLEPLHLSPTAGARMVFDRASLGVAQP